MKVHSPGHAIEALGGVATDALTLVASKEKDIASMKRLAFRLAYINSPDPAEIYNVVRRIDQLPSHSSDDAEHWQLKMGEIAHRAACGGSLSPAQEAALALGSAIEIWTGESARNANTKGGAAFPLFFAVASSPEGNGEMRFDNFEASLVMQPGSRLARLFVGKVFQFAKWSVGLLASLRSPRSAADDVLRHLRAQQLKTARYKLPQISDEKLPALVEGKRGVLIFLHGLFSSDLGTFDGFIDRWLSPNSAGLPAMGLEHISRSLSDRGDKQLVFKKMPEGSRDAIRDSVALVGWQHDTLDRIDNNARDLADHIERALGASDCQIAFVCHSRGGLVARAAAEKLYARDPRWLNRIRSAITFGTPHDGSDLAEHPDLAAGAYVLAGSSTKSLMSVFDLLVYTRQRGTIEGIRDLRPRGAPGPNFLESLASTEAARCAHGPRRLTVHAVSSDYRGRAPEDFLHRIARWYVTRAKGEISDLVVTTSSAAAKFRPSGLSYVASCDHFEYLTAEECQQAHVDALIAQLWKDFGLAAEFAPVLTKQKAEEEAEELIIEAGRLIIDKVSIPLNPGAVSVEAPASGPPL